MLRLETGGFNYAVSDTTFNSFIEFIVILLLASFI